MSPSQRSLLENSNFIAHSQLHSTYLSPFAHFPKCWIKPKPIHRQHPSPISPAEPSKSDPTCKPIRKSLIVISHWIWGAVMQHYDKKNLKVFSYATSIPSRKVSTMLSSLIFFHCISQWVLSFLWYPTTTITLLQWQLLEAIDCMYLSPFTHFPTLFNTPPQSSSHIDIMETIFSNVTYSFIKGAETIQTCGSRSYDN